MEILRAETNEFPHLKVCIDFQSYSKEKKKYLRIEYGWSDNFFNGIINY
jgi:hypothetical protein